MGAAGRLVSAGRSSLQTGEWKGATPEGYRAQFEDGRERGDAPASTCPAFKAANALKNAMNGR